MVSESMPPLTDAAVEALVETAGKATPGPWTDEAAGLHPHSFVAGPEVHTEYGHDSFLVAYVVGIGSTENRKFIALANPSAILSWSARDADQMRRIAELEAQLDTARECALREAAAAIKGRQWDANFVPWEVVERAESMILALIPAKGPTDAK